MFTTPKRHVLAGTACFGVDWKCKTWQKQTTKKPGAWHSKTWQWRTKSQGWTL